MFAYCLFYSETVCSGCHILRGRARRVKEESRKIEEEEEEKRKMEEEERNRTKVELECSCGSFFTVSYLAANPYQEVMVPYLSCGSVDCADRAFRDFQSALRPSQGARRRRKVGRSAFDSRMNLLKVRYPL